MRLEEWVIAPKPARGAPMPASGFRGFLAGPKGAWQGLPAILYIHAHGHDYALGARELIDGRKALQTPPYGQALAQAGIVSLAIDLATFGSRAAEPEASLAKRLLWQGETLFGAMLADLVGALDLLVALEGVDGARIGALGMSMGATLAFWLGALEPRIKLAAHLNCFADLATLIALDQHDRHSLYMLVPGLVRDFSTGEIAGLMAPRPQFAAMGLADPLTPPEAVERALTDLRAAYAKAGAAGDFEVLLLPESGHVETALIRERVLDFLARRL